MIPEQSSESLRKKVRTGKAFAQPLGQPSLDMCSRHPEPEAGRKAGATGSGGEELRSVKARYIGLVCCVQESGLHPEGNGDPLKGQTCVL